MSLRILNRSFSGGEITPELFGRLDLSKVQESLALCRNFITLPHGPVVNRPGTEFVEEVKNSANATRVIPFSYNNTQTFAIQLGAGYFRFHTQGGTLQAGTLPPYVVSTAVAISIAAPAVITWNNHGLAANAPVTFSTTGALPTGINTGQIYYVVNPTTNTFQIAATAGGTAIATSGTQSGTQTCSYVYNTGDTANAGGVNYYCTTGNTGNAPPNAAYWYAMPANGDYEIPNPYAAADLFDVHYTQSADVLTLVHPNYPIYELRRYGATNWQLVPVSFAPKIDAPAASNAPGTPITHTYAILTFGWVPNILVDVSPLSASASCSNDLTVPGSYNIISWNPVQRALTYYVFKLINGTWCLLGTSQGTTFRDDSSRTASAPYVNSTRAWGDISAPSGVAATSYAASAGPTSLNAVPTGTGTTSYSYVCTAVDENGNESYASSVATCQNNLSTAGQYNTINIPAVAGAVRYNVYKLSNGAYGYIGQGAGQTFVDNNITPDFSRTPPLVPANVLMGAGNYPAAVAYYQQRRIFAGTASQPQNVWATRSGTEGDMSYTIPTRDDNRIAFKIAGREASAIRHIVPLQDLLFLSASCEWKCSSTTGVLTPSTVNVQPQSYIGANNVQPVVVGNAVLYAAARGGHIRQMNYNWQINGYQSTDSCIFAPHLFDYNTIVDMAYSRGPIPILWCVSSSGKLLGMTYLPEQQIAAWHQHTTGAADVFESICTITENNEDMLYCVVRRNFNGVTHRFVERLHTRLYNTLADCHYVDCGATYNGASNKSGTYVRSGTTTLTGSITGHGFTSGQNYWFSFSDPSLGTLPTGSPYTVTVVDANTFTFSVANSPALTASNAGVSGAVNGSNTAFDLLGASGEAVAALSGAPAVYKADWQGNQLQYATPRTNLLSYTSGGFSVGWGLYGLTQGASTVPAGGGFNLYQFIESTGTAGGSGHQAQQGGVILQPGSYVWSFIAKAGTRTWAQSWQWPLTTSTTLSAFYDLVNGVAYGDGSPWMVPLGNGVWRCFKIVTVVAAGSTGFSLGPSDGTQTQVYNGDGASYVYIGCPQVEAGVVGTSFIPNTATPAPVTDYTLTNPAHVVFASAPAAGSTLSWSGSYFNTSGTLTFLPNIITGLGWLNGMTVNILADGAVVPPQVVTNNSITLPTGATQVHVGLPLTAQLQTPPAAQSVDPAFAQGLPKNVNKVFLRTYRSSGILAGPDFVDLTPYRQRTTENPGSPPNMVSDEVEILLSNEWGTSGQVCIQQSDPLPLDIAAMTLEIAVGGGT